MRFALVFAFLIALVGCDSAPTLDPGYAAYLKNSEMRQQQALAAIAGISAASSACTDARCVEHVASVAALAYANGGGAGANVAPPPRQISGAEKFAAVAGALSPLAGAAITGFVQVKQTQANRDVSLAQYGWLGGVVHDVSSASTSIATAGPRIEVGGDYVTGTQVGRDQISGNPVTIGRDAIGGDRIDNGGTIHTGDGDRYGSPGPYTGPICTGDGCQPADAATGGGG